MYHLNPIAFPRKNTSVILLSADHTFDDGDKIFFTVKTKPDNNETDSDALIRASWTVGQTVSYDDEGHLPLTLTPEQTDIDFGKYYYDVKSVTQSGIATTVVFGEIEILPVVTLRGSEDEG